MRVRERMREMEIGERKKKEGGEVKREKEGQ